MLRQGLLVLPGEMLLEFAPSLEELIAEGAVLEHARRLRLLMRLHNSGLRIRFLQRLRLRGSDNIIFSL